jgi:hypothetical protein
VTIFQTFHCKEQSKAYEEWAFGSPECSFSFSLSLYDLQAFCFPTYGLSYSDFSKFSKKTDIYLHEEQLRQRFFCPGKTSTTSSLFNKTAAATKRTIKTICNTSYLGNGN